VDLPTDETEKMVLGVATGKWSKTQIADFFRRLLSAPE
jgi:hypothetical protein